MTVIPVIHIGSSTKAENGANDQSNHNRTTSTRIGIIYRIVIAVAIEVQTIDGFGIQVGSVVRRDKSAPFGAVVSGVTEVQASVVIVVVTTITDWVGGLLSYILPFFPPAVKRVRTMPGPAVFAEYFSLRFSYLVI